MSAFGSRFPPSPASPAPRSWRLGRGLYAILDLGSVGDLDPRAVAEALLRSGAAVLQLRAKDPQPGASLVALGASLGLLARRFGVPFLVNDDVELTLRCGAQGVHLGQGDAPPEGARERLGHDAIIGLSTHSLGQALSALSRPVDYIGFGPVFETRTKANPDPVQGLSVLGEVCAQVPLPVVAIGGLTTDRAPEVARAGARAAAAIGAILGAGDTSAIESEARLFHNAFHNAFHTGADPRA